MRNSIKSSLLLGASFGFAVGIYKTIIDCVATVVLKQFALGLFPLTSKEIFIALSDSIVVNVICGIIITPFYFYWRSVFQYRMNILITTLFCLPLFLLIPWIYELTIPFVNDSLGGGYRFIFYGFSISPISIVPIVRIAVNVAIWIFVLYGYKNVDLLQKSD